MPSYVCSALLNAVGPTNLKWRLIDNEPGGVHFNSSKLKLADDELLIAPQMFGFIKSLSGFPKSNLIEDGAMSLGPGSLQQGIVSITSFYATKMLTSGQGGAILTDDDNLAEASRDLIAYDNRSTYRQRFNYAPNDLSSAIGRVQLSKLDGLLKQRSDLAKTYDALIKTQAPGIIACEEGLSAKNPGLFRYWVKVSNLESCIEHLKSKGVESKSPVFRPLHRYVSMPASNFTHAEAAQSSILSLPFHPNLKEKELSFVVKSLAEVATPITRPSISSLA
jgi:perosamine synthetase